MKYQLSEILDNIDVLVYVADLKSYEILYINKYTRSLFGDIEGKICWQSLQQGQDRPCSFCTNDKIVTADGNPTGTYHWEFQNTETGKWFDIRDKAIEWNDGRLVRLEVATDITKRKKTEEEYASLIKNIPIVVWKTDRKGNTIFISQNIEKVYGYTQEEIYKNGESLWFGRIHPEDIGKLKESYSNFFKHEGIYDIEYRIKRKDGEWIWLHDKAVTIYETDGEHYAYGIFSDITDRKKAAEALMESEAKFRSVVESSPMGMHMYHLESDDRLVFVGFNHAADRILRVDNSQFIGKTIEEAFPPLAATEVPERYRQVAAQGESWMTDQIIYEHERIAGAFQVNAFQTESGKMVAMFLDITEKKNAEKEQKRLTAELIIKNKELEQVLYVTSHDLRSPLVNVEGYSKELDYSLKELMSSIENEQVPSSIKEKINPIVKEDIPESLHYIQISVAKMETLLKGILNLSRLGRSELKIEEIDMNEMMTDIVDNHRFRLNELRINTEVSKLPNCKGDISQINQVFSNLLDNAIKYSDSERSCVINISGYKDKDQSVYCIEDNGIGIAPAHQDIIFEIFHQLEPNRFKGEGMGLTIAHRIIEKHKGKIWVDSELGKGSKFFVSLPKA
jgi:PAS domain S-box-containing protein